MTGIYVDKHVIKYRLNRCLSNMFELHRVADLDTTGQLSDINWNILQDGIVIQSL